MPSIPLTCSLLPQVRHTESGKQAPRMWQQRPLSNELITCAAADVTYLIAIMELQVKGGGFFQLL